MRTLILTFFILLSSGLRAPSARAEVGLNPNAPVPQPGNMGPLALPTLPNEDPVIASGAKGRGRLSIEGSLITSFSSNGEDLSVAPYMRVYVPFYPGVALTYDYVMYEHWRTGEATRIKNGAYDRRGGVQGDMRAGAIFYLKSETENIPAVGLRIVVKTTTGKDFRNHRFLDAPGYYFDILMGKNVYESKSRDALLTKIRILGTLGFFAWQQGAAEQDDALDYGATSVFEFRDGTKFSLEFRGYTAYQDQDDPMLLSVKYTHPGRKMDWVTSVDKGLTEDALDYKVISGVAMHWDTGVVPGSYKRPLNLRQLGASIRSGLSRISGRMRGSQIDH